MEQIIVRWTANGGDAGILFQKKDLKKKIYNLMRDYPHKFQVFAEELADIISGATSLYLDVDGILKDDPMPIVIEYYFNDGNLGKTRCSKEKYIKEFLFNVFFYDHNEKSKCISAEYELKYIKNSRQYRKEISRKEINKIFSEFIAADAMNNGISKKIVAINMYAKELFINFDNTAEINSIYFKTYFDEIGIIGMPIPYIHRIMWECLRKICNNEG